MKNINTGGSAFPHGYAHSAFCGMTLRDYFAAKAMNAYWNDPEVSDCVNTPESVARWAYEIADAMLKEREA